MHHAKGGLHLTDIMKNFTIPNNTDQAYMLEEIVNKVHFFKGIFRKTQGSIGTSLEASSSKHRYQESRSRELLELKDKLFNQKFLLRNVSVSASTWKLSPDGQAW